MIRGELFNQDMVKAFLENRKFRTSRPIKGIPAEYSELQGIVTSTTGNDKLIGSYMFGLGCSCVYRKLKHSVGDIIYVRETFYQYGEWYDTVKHFKIGEYISTHVFIPKDGHPIYFEDTMPSDVEVKHGHKSGLGYYKRPSLFMPREAARLWFRATDVKVQRLDDVTEQDAVEDGFKAEYHGWAPTFSDPDSGGNGDDEPIFALDKFKTFWLNQYGPDAKWMWAYYLQPVTKNEAET